VEFFPRPNIQANQEAMTDRPDRPHDASFGQEADQKKWPIRLSMIFRRFMRPERYKYPPIPSKTEAQPPSPILAMGI
jgi:hypothetical protein